VLSCVRMRISRCFPMVLALLVCSCANEPATDHQAEWRDVLRHKPAAVAPDASPDHKQVYADSVRAFVEKHPHHNRASEVWARLQLEFADDLAEGGRYQDAIRFYRSVLTKHPENDHARQAMARAAARLAVTHEGMLELRKGMTHRQVASILGKPLPGWSVKQQRAGTDFEAWYYRTRSGALAAVYFREGKVIAAEETADQKLGRLGS